MIIKIKTSDDIDHYKLVASVNNDILKDSEISYYAIDSNFIEINNKFICYPNDNKENILKRILKRICSYIFVMIYLNFNSLDDLLFSNEYTNIIHIKSLEDNSIVEINYCWNEEEKKIDMKLDVINVDIISNEMLVNINEKEYQQKKRIVKETYIFEAVIIFSIGITFLILAIIFNDIRMIIGQIVILSFFIMVFSIVFLNKKNKL